MGSSSGGCQTAGYWYSAGMHLVFCTGIDELLSIVVGEKTAWAVGETLWRDDWIAVPYCYKSDSRYNVRVTPPCPYGYTEVQSWELVRVSYIQQPVYTNTTVSIDKKNLFGGQDGGSGGIVGSLDIEFGLSDQEQNTYLQSKLGADIPAYRGVFGLVLKHMALTCNTPQIKPWAIRARRCLTGWLPDISRIGDGMNPIHIICDCLFDAGWGGVGLPEAKRGDSFALAANALYLENFGLSFLWARNNSIDNFVTSVLKHIDATLYQDYETGKLEIKLVRDDYGDISGLPVFNESNIKAVESFDAKSTTELINTITIKFTDPTNGKDQSLTFSDISAVDRANGDIVPIEREYFGIHDGDIASKVALRDLRLALLPLATTTFIANREGFSVKPGDVINYSWAPHSFENVAMRVAAVDIGTLDSSYIRIDAIMDVFAFGDSTIAAPPNGDNWTDPINDPVDMTDYSVREVTYWDLQSNSGMLDDTDTADGTRMHMMAPKPTVDSADFELWDNIPDTMDYTVRGVADFSDTITVSNEVGIETQSTLILDSPLPYTDVATGGITVGDTAYYGDEIVGLVSINEDRDQLVVSRGLVDTVPVAHNTLDKLQFYSSTTAIISTQEFTDGEDVNFKLLSRTSNGRLHLDDATEHTYSFLGRLSRPYPPGNVKVNEERYPEALTSLIDKKWYPDEYDSSTAMATVNGDKAHLSVDPSLDLTGSSTNEWLSTTISNQKFSFDLGQQRIFDSFTLCNSHNYGTSTTFGIKNFELFGTNDHDAFANVSDYADETDLVSLGTFIADEHTAVDEVDYQEFSLSAFARFRYVVLKITDNHGGGNLGFRHIEVNSPDGYIISFSHRNRLEQISDVPESQHVGNIGPESGCTYNVETVDIGSSTVIQTITNSEYTVHFLTGLDTVGELSITVGAERNGQESHSEHIFSFMLVGYGKSYGYSYGGVS